MATLTLRPNAAGDLTEIPFQNPDSTWHWDKVDEEVADNDTTYVYDSSTLANVWKDLYNIPNHTTEGGPINFVKFYIRARVVEISSAGYFRIYFKTGGVEYTGGSNYNDTAWTTHSQQYNDNPGGGDWTWAQIDALQIGAQVQAGNGMGGQSIVKVTQVYVEVDYTPLGGRSNNMAAKMVAVECI